MLVINVGDSEDDEQVDCDNNGILDTFGWGYTYKSTFNSGLALIATWKHSLQYKSHLQFLS